MSSTIATTDGTGRALAMSAREARECADMIKGCLDNARELILELHDRKGWQSLGYKSWKECVEIEFAQARSSLHYQLEAAKVAKEIKASGVQNLNTDDIPDSHLRELASVPNEERAEVYREAVAESGGKPTAAKVQEVVERKSGATSAPVVTEVVGFVDDDEAVPFRDAAEMREAFLEVIAVQEECTAKLVRNNYNRRMAECREADTKSRDASRRFLDKLSCDEGCDGSYAVTIDGVTYVTTEGTFNYGWFKARTVNLDVPPSPPPAVKPTPVAVSRPKPEKARRPKNVVCPYCKEVAETRTGIKGKTETHLAHKMKCPLVNACHDPRAQVKDCPDSMLGINHGMVIELR